MPYFPDLHMLAEIMIATQTHPVNCYFKDTHFPIIPHTQMFFSLSYQTFETLWTRNIIYYLYTHALYNWGFKVFRVAPSILGELLLASRFYFEVFYRLAVHGSRLPLRAFGRILIPNEGWVTTLYRTPIISRSVLLAQYNVSKRLLMLYVN